MTERDGSHKVRVRHPILRLDVVAADGTRQTEHRVFCRLQHHSVSVGECCVCANCDAIVEDPTPVIDCTICVNDAEVAPDELGVRTPVGSVLCAGALVVEMGTSIGDAFRLLRSEDRRSLAIVDAENIVIGVVHEAAFAPPSIRLHASTDVGEIMSTAISIHESLPVRRALELLAAAHLREATIVDDDEVPLGVFRDIDGLQWLSRAKNPRPR